MQAKQYEVPLIHLFIITVTVIITIIITVVLLGQLMFTP